MTSDENTVDKVLTYYKYYLWVISAAQKIYETFDEEYKPIWNVIIIKKKHVLMAEEWKWFKTKQTKNSVC